MTILRFEGFETIGTDATTDANVQTRLEVRDIVSQSGGLECSLIVDASGEGYSLRMPNTTVAENMAVFYELPVAYKVTQNASVGTFVFGARVKIPNDGASVRLFGWHVGSAPNAPNMTLSISSSGSDIILSSGSVTISSIVTAGDWHYIEWEFKPTSSASGGYQKVHVDGVEVYDSGAANVSASFFTAWGFSIYGQQSLNGVGDAWVAYDDVVITELDGVTHTAAIGPRRVYRAVPTSDVSVQWTPASGSNNYAMVDDIEYTPGDYVESSTDGHVDTYGHGGPLYSADVEAVQVEAECINTVVGTPTLYVGLDDGTTEDLGDVVDNTADNSYVRKLFDDKPSGGAWDTVSFNATDIRIRFGS